MSNKFLYDIVQLLEWPPDKEVKLLEDAKKQKQSLFKTGRVVLSSASKKAWNLVKTSAPHSFVSSYTNLASVIELKRQQGKGSCSVSPCGRFIAIFLTSVLEIRCLEDLSTVYGSYSFIKKYDFERNIAWSHDGAICAILLHNKTVHLFDTKCKLLSTLNLIPSDANTDFEQIGQTICAMLFMKTRDKQNPHPWEFLILRSDGILKSFFVSADGNCEFYHEFNFESNYVFGLSCATLDNSERLLVVGGNSCGFARNKIETTAFELGIARWRILSDYPYYKRLVDDSIDSQVNFNQGIAQKCRSILLGGLSKLYNIKMDGIHTLAFSPDHTLIAAIHFSGTLSLWHFPSLKLKLRCNLEDQPCCNESNPSLASRFGRKQYSEDRLGSFPFDISWWNNEAMIISRCSGSLSIVSVENSGLVNLFGEHCEWIAPYCKISSTFNEKFFILECYPETDALLDEDRLKSNFSEENETSLWQKSVNLVWSWSGKEAESQKEKICVNKYVLTALNKTTPQELYERKLDDKEFGEALSIAQAYNLDCDKVFQRQWKLSPVSRASIQDYLAKIENCLWVFRECVDCVPNSIDDTKELFNFALSITDLDKMAKLGNIDIESNDEEEIFDDYDGFDYDEQQRRNVEARQNYEKKWLQHINFDSLNFKQKEMLKCRQKILRYFDKLSTYLLLLGGHDAANEQYTSNAFATFRRRDIFHLTLEYVRHSNCEATEILLEYHFNQLNEHRLPLLSSFCETLSPKKYKNLLPCVADGKVTSFAKNNHRANIDWCENLDSYFEKPDAQDFYEINSHLTQFRVNGLTPLLVSEWYHYRAMQMEQLSRQTEEALQLVEFGTKNGVSGLSQLHLDLITLDNLVYECGCDLSLTLENLLSKTPLEQIHLMMAKSSSTAFLRDMQQLVNPFVRANKDTRLLKSYLVETAETNLPLPLLVFKHMEAHGKDEFLFQDHVDVMHTAVECIYAMEEASQLDAAFQILKFLPKCRNKTQVTLLEKNLNACSLLSKHQIPMVPTELKKISEDNNLVLLLYKRLTRTLAYHEAAVSKSKCDVILKDMKSITANMFSSVIDEATCIRVLIEGLLTSGSTENIRLAGEMMVKSETQMPSGTNTIQLPYKDSLELVLSSSQEYFDAASVPLTDNKLLKLSRSCLLLMTDRPTRIQQQLDLIEAVILLGAFGVNMLPLEVRLCKDRLIILRKILDQSPTNYKKIESILRLSALLNVEGSNFSEQKGKTISLIAEKAMEKEDLDVGSQLVMDLIDRSYSPAWKLCVEMGTNKKIPNLAFRHKCIAFASCYGEEDDLVRLSDELCTVTALLLEQRLEEQLAEIEELHRHNLVEELKENSASSATFSSLGRKGSSTLSSGLLTATINTTGVLLGGLSTLTGLANLNSDTNESEFDDNNNDLDCQGCPAFYASILPLTCPDKYTVNYSSYESFNKLSTTRTQTMLRINSLANMEDRVAENLQDLAKEILPRDLTLGLAYLLPLVDAKKVEDCFHHFAPSTLSLQLAIYYYALQTLRASLASEQKSATCFSIYRVPPMTFVNYAIKHLSGETDISISTGLQVATRSLVDFIQGEKLYNLGHSIDVQRCLVDTEYMKETTYGLAMSTDENQFFLAILLAGQGSSDIWPIVATHVEYLFTESKETTSPNEFFDKLRHLKLLTTLISRGPDLFLRFDAQVFPLIDGCDHNTLLCYFSLLKECSWEELEPLESVNSICKLPPVVHIRNLRKMISCAPRCDYKCLISDNASSDVLKQLRLHLNETNISFFMKLIPKMPYKNQSLTSSAVLLCWVLKRFWGTKDDLQLSENDWMKRLESSSKWLQQMGADDIKKFFENILYSQASIDHLSYELRHKFLKSVMKFIKKQKENSKLSEEDVVKFNELSTEYGKLSAHFNAFSSHFIKRLIEDSRDDPMQRKFLVGFDKSRSKPEELLLLATEMMYRSIDFAQQFIASLPASGLKLEQALGRCVADILQEIRLADSETSIANGLSLLEKLLDSINNFKGAKKATLFNIVVSRVQSFCDDDVVDVKLKIDVLQLLRKSAALSSNQTEFLLYHRTAELIRSMWKQELADVVLTNIKNLSEEASHTHIVDSLLDQENSLEQLKTIATIIEMLESDSDDLWRKVLSGITKHGLEGGIAVVNIAKERSFSETVTVPVFEQLVSHSLILAAVKFALITNIPSIKTKLRGILQQVQQIDTTTCDDEMLQLLIDENMISHTLSTFYYHHAVDYLIGGRCINPEEKINMLVRKLQDDGHLAEAATLLLKYKGSHTVFSTFGNSIASISNWLNKLQ